MKTLHHIFKALREAGDTGIHGTEISNNLGISRAAVWSHIEELRTLGYHIDAGPHRGYQLIKTPDILLADDITSQLQADTIVGNTVQIFRQTASTNQLVDQMGLGGVAEGMVVFAESQTEGRGRLGRKWLSPEGKGLWFSLLLRPPLRPAEMTRLTIIAATALARAIRETSGLQPSIKWPNDILINGRKVAGVLTEMSAEPDRVLHAVIGVGVDVNQEQEDFPDELSSVATSLRIESGRPILRSDLAVALLKALNTDYQRILSGQFQAVAEEWESQCITLQKRVRIHQMNQTCVGFAESLDSEGALMVRTPSGHLERITGGDVILEKEPHTP
ncbi:MAG: biotin--[acetyl-CoA-carboxylase] ligase [Verrucomicrobiota bacterium]|nr:biotin--[acetyl-CoA-carboxylase] ligase [Verrucomicrobiota bacterium]